MAGLSPREVAEIYKFDKKINELYEQKKSFIEKIIKERGPCGGFVKLKSANDKPYIRVVLKDLKDDFESGVTLYRNAGLTRYIAEITPLKNAPKDPL